MANNIYELDFTGIQSSNLIPEGIHTVRIVSAEFKKAKTGSDQLQLNFETSDGANRSAWYSLVPQALWKLKGVLECLGIPCEGKIKLNTASFKNKVCEISVEPDPNDESKLVVARVFKSEQTSTPQVAYGTAPAAPIPQAPPMSFTPQASTPVAVMPEEPITPVQQASQPVQNNLPPWMNPQGAPAQASAPQGNLPPWMNPNK